MALTSTMCFWIPTVGQESCSPDTRDFIDDYDYYACCVDPDGVVGGGFSDGYSYGALRTPTTTTTLSGIPTELYINLVYTIYFTGIHR